MSRIAPVAVQVMDRVCAALQADGQAEERLRQALIEEDQSGLGYCTKQQLQVRMLPAPCTQAGLLRGLVTCIQELPRGALCPDCPCGQAVPW